MEVDDKLTGIRICEKVYILVQTAKPQPANFSLSPASNKTKTHSRVHLHD